MNSDITDFKDIIQYYNQQIKPLDLNAYSSNSDRAYGGIVRASKGKMIEKMAKDLIWLSWRTIGGGSRRISFKKKEVKIPINMSYIERVKNLKIRRHLEKKKSEQYYIFRPDIHVSIDDNLIMTIECKAYTENAMLKRILVDASLTKKVFPNIYYVLFQLESQLGGDYSSIFNDITYGSSPSNTLMSYFDINLEIITLLEGERKVDEPIHKTDYFKELKEESLNNVIKFFNGKLKPFI